MISRQVVRWDYNIPCGEEGNLITNSSASKTVTCKMHVNNKCYGVDILSKLAAILLVYVILLSYGSLKIRSVREILGLYSS